MMTAAVDPLHNPLSNQQDVNAKYVRQFSEQPAGRQCKIRPTIHRATSRTSMQNTSDNSPSNQLDVIAKIHPTIRQSTGRTSMQNTSHNPPIQPVGPRCKLRPTLPCIPGAQPSYRSVMRRFLLSGPRRLSCSSFSSSSLIRARSCATSAHRRT
jgi:hypothetical protein